MPPYALEALRDELGRAVDEVLVSQRAGHVGELVRGAQAADGIVVAGGDGTLFEVLQACDRSRQRIALLPMGRGNSLARDLAMVSSAELPRCLASGVDRRVDLLGVTLTGESVTWSGVSASNLAIGYPAEVVRTATRWRRLGTAGYAVAAAVVGLEPLDMTVVWHDDPACRLRVTGLVVSNCRYVGPFLGFPMADLSDGVFDVMQMQSGPLGQTAHNLSTLTGMGFYEPAKVRAVRSVRITLDRPALLKIDGELREGVREVAVVALPGAVTFRVPGGGRG